ncbi:fasciclin domain-containing protein [Mucilaginibacter mali]|uniref:Fasciclin domain-containing protein n=1 Tax=Mucilaginibacter mali TaxID=2740462 RepID=A0A7D4TT04_9SPHI|nr:fasciclin domain-containing protein [Mucilaginibacter mali]QKJ28755.1 fasciclin domain-containing protein [Mucilaginibacter mali]
MKKVFFLLVLATVAVGLSKTYAQSTALKGIKDDSDFYKFATLVRQANMDATLNALGSFTMFAPDNTTFREMPGDKLDSIAADPAKLTALLKAHIVKGKFTTNEIIKKLTLGKGKTTLTNLLGQTLKLSRTPDNKLLITDANGDQVHFLAFDMPDAHGVIHGIDHLLVAGK